MDNDVDFSFMEDDVEKVKKQIKNIDKKFNFYDTTKKHLNYKFGLNGIGMNCDYYSYQTVYKNGKKYLMGCLSEKYVGTKGGRDVPYDYIFPLRKVSFLGRDVFVPNKPLIYLENRYGYIGKDYILDDVTMHYSKK